MTKFEQIGVNRQFDAVNTEDANKAFARSCEVCCNRGIKLDCDKCCIAYTHKLICAYFCDRANESAKGNTKGGN